MLERGDFQCIDMDSPFICVHVDKATDDKEDVELTRANLIGFALLFKVFSRSKRNTGIKAWKSSLKNGAIELKDTLFHLFQAHCDSGLFRRKFQFPDYL